MKVLRVYSRRRRAVMIVIKRKRLDLDWVSLAAFERWCLSVCNSNTIRYSGI